MTLKEFKILVLTAIIYFLFGFLFGVFCGKNLGWEAAYRSIKSGTIEKEIQQRNPALWIKLNKGGKP